MAAWREGLAGIGDLGDLVPAWHGVASRLEPAKGSEGPPFMPALNSSRWGIAGGPVQPRAGPADPDITGLVMQRTLQLLLPENL